MKLRKYIAINMKEKSSFTIDQEVISKLVDFLGFSDRIDIQFEALWCLTNICCGTTQNIYTVLRAGALDRVKLLICHSDKAIREQAVWLIGNIAGDCIQLRDYLLLNQFMPLLSKNFQHKQMKMLQNLTWAISNLCRGKPAPSWEYVKDALPYIIRIIGSQVKIEILSDACWALSYMSDGPNERIQTIVDYDVCKFVVKFLSIDYIKIQLPSLRVIGNIATGTHEHTDYILSLDVLPILKDLLESDQKILVKETCWTISNITAGTPIHIQRVMDSGLFTKLLVIVHKSDDPLIRREAAWAISNAISCGNTDLINYFVSQGFLKIICELLTSQEPRTIISMLDCIDKILKQGEKDKENYLSSFESLNGFDILEELQNHQNEEIYSKSFYILENYCSGEPMIDMNIFDYKPTTLFI